MVHSLRTCLVSTQSELAKKIRNRITVSTFAPLVPQCVSLDDFVAFNDEIAALARAGVPLERGLAALGSDLPGSLGRLVTEVGQRLERGETFEQVIERSPELFPPAYRAVALAGAKTGRLPAALESISQIARRTAQARRSIGLAMIYPLFLVVLAYSLLDFWIVKLAPVMGRAMRELSPRTGPVWDTIDFAAATIWAWGPVAPLALVTWLGWHWWRTRQVARGVDAYPLLALGPLWRLWKMRLSGRLAAMTDMLALLTEYGVPLPQAVVLAAQASGDKRLIGAAHDLAERLTAGAIEISPREYPPLLTWTLTGGIALGELPSILRRLAGIYRDEAQRHSQWLSIYVPLLMSVVIGGVTVAVMAAVYFGPFILILYQLSEATYYAK